MSPNNERGVVVSGFHAGDEVKWCSESGEVFTGKYVSCCLSEDGDHVAEVFTGKALVSVSLRSLFKDTHANS